MPLPINFHRTFIPERRFISDLLEFAAQGRFGDYHKISVDTGIPMGKSNGKVPAIIDYARGMGLITIAEETRSSIKKPTLTEFGRIVFCSHELHYYGIWKGAHFLQVSKLVTTLQGTSNQAIHCFKYNFFDRCKSG